MFQTERHIPSALSALVIDGDLFAVRSVLESAGCSNEAITSKYVATRKEFSIDLGQVGSFSMRQIEHGKDRWALTTAGRSLPLLAPLTFCCQSGLRELGKPAPDDLLLKLDRWIDPAGFGGCIGNRSDFPWSRHDGAERHQAAELLRTFCRFLHRNASGTVYDLEDGRTLLIDLHHQHFTVRQAMKEPEPLRDTWRYVVGASAHHHTEGRLVEMFALIYQDNLR